MANEGGFRLPRRGKVSDTLKAIGLKMLAMDGDPEDIQEAVDELVNEKYEAEKRYRRQVRAHDLWFAIVEAQIETGNPYMVSFS